MMAKNKSEVLASPANIQELKQFIRTHPGELSDEDVQEAKSKLREKKVKKDK